MQYPSLKSLKLFIFKYEQRHKSKSISENMSEIRLKCLFYILLCKLYGNLKKKLNKITSAISKFEIQKLFILK